MKKILGVSILAALLVGCADSGQGGTAGTETGAGAAVNVSEPGVAPDAGTRPVISTGAVTEAPARPVPIPSGQEAKPEASRTEVQGTVNEQGTQTSPEPRTGDDANPDSVNPRR